MSLLTIWFSQTQAEIPSSLQLQSSGSLGTGRAATHQDRLDRLEDKQVRRAMDGRAGKRKRHDDFNAVTHADEDSCSDDHLLEATESSRPPANKSENVGLHLEPSTMKSASVVVNHQPVVSAPPVVGSALQRNADGTLIMPKVRERKGKKVRVANSVRQYLFYIYILDFLQKLERCKETCSSCGRRGFGHLLRQF